MPKERVYGSVPSFDGTAASGGPGVSVVEVGWNREAGHCQIVTKAVRADDGERLAQDPPGEVAISYLDGFYVDLDRDGINGLIRNLRRARDQAFGRDE